MKAQICYNDHELVELLELLRVCLKRKSTRDYAADQLDLSDVRVDCIRRKLEAVMNSPGPVVYPSIVPGATLSPAMLEVLGFLGNSISGFSHHEFEINLPSAPSPEDLIRAVYRIGERHGAQDMSSAVKKALKANELKSNAVQITL